MLRRSSFTWMLALVAAGCAGPPGPPPSAKDGGTDAGVPVDGGHPGEVALRGCTGHASPVGTVAQVSERLNALQKPVSLPCFVASLPRPFSVVATTSVVSAQPAASAKSPRIFIFQPGLVLSVVPEGNGAAMLELAQWETTTRTLKGELPFPVTSALAADAALTRIEQSNGTTPCGVCHRAEIAHATIAHGYVSAAYRPNPGNDVKLSALLSEHQACVDSSDTSERCAFYHALFDFGPVQQGAFSTSVSLFP